MIKGSRLCVLNILLLGCASVNPKDNNGPTLRIIEKGYRTAVLSTIEGIVSDPVLCGPGYQPGYPYHYYGGGALDVSIDAKDPSGVEYIQALVAGHHTVTDFGSASVELGTYQSPAGPRPGTFVIINFGAESPPQVVGPLTIGNLSFRVNPSQDENLNFFITASDSAGNETDQPFIFARSCPSGSLRR
jgi:hypothetical protein